MVVGGGGSRDYTGRFQRLYAGGVLVFSLSLSKAEQFLEEGPFHVPFSLS